MTDVEAPGAIVRGALSGYAGDVERGGCQHHVGGVAFDGPGVTARGTPGRSASDNAAWPGDHTPGSRRQSMQKEPIRHEGGVACQKADLQ